MGTKEGMYPTSRRDLVCGSQDGKEKGSGTTPGPGTPDTLGTEDDLESGARGVDLETTGTTGPVSPLTGPEPRGRHEGRE